MKKRAALATLGLALLWAQDLKLPNKPDTLHLAIIGDTGTGEKPEYEVASKLVEWRKVFAFDNVLMMGDNMYGGEKPRDFVKKFEEPYRPLLDAGVKFYAVLGNHDDPNERFYKYFNMNGQRYYTFKLKNVQFFALDSNYMDRDQLAWLEKELSASKARWKVAFFHHPPYSSGEAHGSDVQLRAVVEPLFVKYGVNIVLSGHEHFYERIKPQKGIYYFICGGSAKLRKGNIEETELMAKGLDTDNSFMLMEIGAEQAYYQAVSRSGRTVDAGELTRAVLKAAPSGE